MRMLFSALTTGPLKGTAYGRLAELCDRFGHRLAGSAALESAIDHVLKRLGTEGFDRVSSVSAAVPHWVRGSESATVSSASLLAPRPLSILGLGRSIGTPPDGLEADLLVVADWAELQLRAAEARGAIVLLNAVYDVYPTAVAYRAFGADKVAAAGGVAVLVRSIAPWALGAPHTGGGTTGGGPTSIPAAAIALHDADMLARMDARGWAPRVRLFMGAQDLPPAQSRNIVVEIAGSEWPEQIVLLSAHIDSWDVGTGAVDDGGGVAVSWAALSAIAALPQRPRRTVRLVLFTSEEMGGGAAAYWAQHGQDNYTVVMETDSGTFEPVALQLSAPVAAHAAARRLGALVAQLGGGGEVRSGGEGTDIGPVMARGVPGASLLTRPNTWFRAPQGAGFQGDYFFFHHSAGDTLAAQDSGQMDRCAATWAAFALGFANLDEPLPGGPAASAQDVAAALGPDPSAQPPPVCAPDWSPDAARDACSAPHQEGRGRDTNNDSSTRSSSSAAQQLLQQTVRSHSSSTRTTTT